ncbi:efflux RND transporter periplasmic adaptor subunit [Oceanicoccus sp. KOV_DT_Chl]|uniref:efflux RND transporter periplasmic adaptor subunit n=1 Tax=Oceanicoccus sp. KOV_DT_Chl TaxID=1904639 RepID=UPI000C7AC9A1|nr:efflux RND transporter periplasmic adaptor subunit [Oceanicoccus sp. KOV_DT_Chl]
MTLFNLFRLLIVAALLAGAFWLGANSQTSQPALAALDSAPLYWVAPMDPNYRRDKPGKSPMGMDLVPVYAGQSARGGNDSVDVTVSAAVVNNLGVKTTGVEFSPLQQTLNTVGYVRFDEDLLHHIHVRVDGWIETLNVSAEGDPVSKGELLFELYSPTLFNAQKDLLLAMGNGGEQLIRSAKQRLRLMGMQAQQIEQVASSGQAKERIGVFAEHNGIVNALNVRHGMYIEPANEIMAVASVQRLWVIAEVFERQATWLQQGQNVSIAVDSYPGEQWQGVVDYIYPVLNSDARTLQIRVQVKNDDGRLKPNMFANLSIDTRNDTSVLHIPRSALIADGHSQRVVKSMGAGKFRSVVVVVGQHAGDRVEIIKGVTAQDSVVIAAQFLIDSESNVAAEFDRIDDGISTSKESGDSHD